MSEAPTVISAPGPACSTCGAPLPAGHQGRVCVRCSVAMFDDVIDDAGFSIPGYEILGELARGGMGAVYHARQLRPEREVALKVLLPQFADDPEMLARFQIEARAMAALDHAGILPVYEVGEAAGTPYFSMKLATGGSLAGKIKNGPLPPRTAAALVAELGRAVHHAHQHGVLHRDLKPANFLFDDDGRAYVSDFGLAKLPLQSVHGGLTRTESFFGTPHYMPPEVAGGSVGDSTVAGDLYSLGAVLYECLTGKRPHGRHEALGTLLRAIVDEPIVPPRQLAPLVSRDLEIICLKALEKAPAARYPTVGDFADDLQRWLEGRPVSARPVGTAEKIWRWARRHPLPAGLAAGLAAVTAVGGILLARSYKDRGAALNEARMGLRQSLIDQARFERLLGHPGHRQQALRRLRQAAEILPAPEIRDEAAALLARPDVFPVSGSPGPAPIPWPQDYFADDPATHWQEKHDRSLALSLHASGAAALWKAGSREPLRQWEPGVVGVGDFAGENIVIAAADGAVSAEAAAGSVAPRQLLPAGPLVSFLTVSPQGNRVALGRADGLSVLDAGTGQLLWHHGSLPVRCAPAWTGDGAHLATAPGEASEVAVHEVVTGRRLWTHPTSGWPTHLAFAPRGDLLAAATDQGTVTLLDLRTGRDWMSVPAAAAELMQFSPSGLELLVREKEGAVRTWRLQAPVGFREWIRQSRSEADENVFGMALSPDARWLLTTATGGVRFWSVAAARECGFHPTENQRIDAPTAAWWLSPQEILVQVPGGLERIAVDAQGQPGAPQRVKRPPGSSVVSVAPDGAWIVKITDPDTGDTFEEWPAGDSSRALPLTTPPPAAAPGIPFDANDVVDFRGCSPPLRLIPPEILGIRSVLPLPGGKRLLVLGRQHRVVEWDTEELLGKLAAEGF